MTESSAWHSPIVVQWMDSIPWVPKNGTQSGDKQTSIKISCWQQLGIKSFWQPTGVGEGGWDILHFKIRIEMENFLTGSPLGNETCYRSHSDSHPSDAGLTAHDQRISGNSIHRIHKLNSWKFLSEPMFWSRCHQLQACKTRFDRRRHASLTIMWFCNPAIHF